MKLDRLQGVLGAARIKPTSRACQKPQDGGQDKLIGAQKDGEDDDSQAGPEILETPRPMQVMKISH